MKREYMSETIGESLGIILALFEEDLRENPDNLEMLHRVHKISDIYRNFTMREFRGFQAEFEKGYDAGKADTKRDRKPYPPELSEPNTNDPGLG